MLPDNLSTGRAGIVAFIYKSLADQYSVLAPGFPSYAYDSISIGDIIIGCNQESVLCGAQIVTWTKHMNVDLYYTKAILSDTYHVSRSALFN